MTGIDLAVLSLMALSALIVLFVSIGTLYGLVVALRHYKRLVSN